MPYLVLIKDSVNKIFEYIGGRSREDFLADEVLKDACLTRLIVIGEYSAKVSVELKKAHPKIEWREMRAARNFFAHAYGHINWQMVWDTIQNDLPAVRMNIQKIIEHLEEAR